MLTALSIKNYALIEDIQIDLESGFTTITGETGAGKSIVLGALSLLLGKRADLSAIRDTDQKCVIEGSFRIGSYQLEKLFEAEDLDYEPQTIIRREILPSGKSRAFVNDTPANLNALQILGEHLIDIHSQHETRNLGDLDYQFMILDALAGNEHNLRNFRRNLEGHRRTQRKLQDLKEEQASAAREYEYHLFLLEELRKANLKEGDQEVLEERYEELSNVEELTEQLGAAINAIQQEEVGAAAQLKSAQSNLQRISRISGAYEQLFERLQSLNIELDDIVTELEASLEKVEADPGELSQINEKLQTIYNLQKKHAAGSISELLEIQQELLRKVAVTENADEQVAALEKELALQAKQLFEEADALHENRKKITAGFIGSIEAILTDLGMPNAQIRIDLSPQQDLNNYGRDKMTWLLSANKGGHFNEIKKAASGGEMSRIMLAVKSILVSYSKLPTIIFDEIDTGVSGEIAQKMGEILRQMGRSMQVLAITHLPQIAGKGGSHFKVYKEDEADRTITQIRELDSEERVTEIAQMLGGRNFSDSAVVHARALLN